MRVRAGMRSRAAQAGRHHQQSTDNDDDRRELVAANTVRVPDPDAEVQICWFSVSSAAGTDVYRDSGWFKNIMADFLKKEEMM